MANPADNQDATPDLRASLEAAFSDAEHVDTAPETPETPETTTAATPAVEKPRDEHGKFKAVEPQAAVVDTTASTADASAAAVPATEVQPERRAPSSWKPDAQAAFATLPPNIQDEVLRRESDYHKGIEGYKTHAQAAQAFERAVQPYMQTIQSLGVDAPTAVGELLKADHTLRYSDPATKARYFSQLAQQYGVDLAQVANPPAVDPQYQALQAQLQRQQNEMQAWKNQQAQREQAVVQTELERFAADPANAHFDAVRDDMALLLESGKAQSLKDAYDTAVWMRGDIRQSLIEQQRAEAQKKATEQAQHQKAKAASVSVKGSSPASGGASAVKGSIRETIEAAFADS
jgi:molybdopterin converting factor small subunit